MSPSPSAARDTERNDLSIYDDVADRWWSDEVRWVRTLKRMVRGRLSWFDPRVDWRGARVLDVGCAGGFMAEALARRGARVTGIDPAARAIDAAREHAAGEGLDIRYDVGVGESLPYPDDAFDVVVCVDVLEHVESVERCIGEMARVLGREGQVCFDTINRNPVARFAAITVAEDLLRLLPKGTHDPSMFIKPDELEATFVRHGFAVDRMAGLGPHGVNLKGDLSFGRVPSTAIIYMGIAHRRQGAADGGAVAP